jgi:DNA-binding GntR family transcriptional regulator
MKRLVAERRQGSLALPSLVQVIADELRRQVLSGQYRPGQRLPEAALAQELGVSRPPLREAMRLLEHEGLLTSEPRHGMFVTPLTVEDIREIYSLRSALESLAMDLALPLEDRARLQPLRDSVDRMRRCVLEGDLAALTVENFQFHREMTALAGHKRLQRAYESLIGQLQMCMAMNLRFRESLIGNRNDVVERHEMLIRLVEAGDVTAVKHALANHGDRAFLSDLEHLLAEDNWAAADSRTSAAHQATTLGDGR